jgi:TRAP-type uncharacterized transport system substrate-binding protein
MSNRTKIALLVVVTLLVTALAVATIDDWFRRPGQVTIAVGPESMPETKFAAKLADVLAQTHSSVRLKLVPHENRGQALARFSHREADLAIVRTDDPKIPDNARALAILERETFLMVGPRKAKFSTLADLAGRKVVVMGRDNRNEVFVRHLLDQYKLDLSKTSIRTVAPEAAMDHLWAGSADLLVMIYPLSRLARGSDFQALAEHTQDFSVHGIGDAKALERKVPGIYVETVEAGLLSGSPSIPDGDIETLSVQKILVARRGMPEQQVVELMRALFEEGRLLAIENSFAAHIEPPDTEKGALIAVHDGAIQYVESEVKTFFETYSDLIYVGMSVLSVLASMAVALYSTLFRRQVHHASERAGELMRLREKAREAGSLGELDSIEGELEAVLDEVLIGLSDGSVSHRGLEAFRLAYDRARDMLGSVRARLER